MQSPPDNAPRSSEAPEPAPAPAPSPQVERAQRDADRRLPPGQDVDQPAQSCTPELLITLYEVIRHGGRTIRRPFGAQRKQYVNLDQRVDPSTPRPEFGDRLRLQARVRWSCGGRSRAGHRIEWTLEHTRFAAASTRHATLGYVGFGRRRPAAGQSRIGLIYNRTDAQGWTPELSVYLPNVGGDQVRILTRAIDSPVIDAPREVYPQAEAILVIWRRIFYQITEMLRPGGGGRFALSPASKRAFVRAYRRQFIRCDERPPRRTIAHRSAMTSTEAVNAARSGFVRDARHPFKAHIIFCDLPNEQTDTVTVSLRVTEPVVAFEVGRAIAQHESSGVSRALRFERDRHDFQPAGNEPDRPAAYVTVQDDYFNDGSSVDIMSHLRADRSAELGSMYRRLVLDLSRAPSAQRPSASRPLNVRLQVRYKTFEHVAHHWGGHIVIYHQLVVGTARAQILVRAMAHVVVHELGHFLRMHHCNWGDPQLEGPSGGRDVCVPMNTDAECVMNGRPMWRNPTLQRWGGGSIPHSEIVRTRDMSRAEMTLSWRSAER